MLKLRVVKMAASALYENEFKDLWNYNLAVDPVLGQSSPYDLDETFTADPFNLKFDALGFEESDDFPLIFQRPVDELPEVDHYESSGVNGCAPAVLPDGAGVPVCQEKKGTGSKRSKGKAGEVGKSKVLNGNKSATKAKLKLKPKQRKPKKATKLETPLIHSVFEHTSLTPVPSSRPAKGRKRSNSLVKENKNKGLLVSKRWKSEDWDSKPADKSFIMANNRIKWSQAEIRTLWRMIAIHGNEWRQVQKPLKGRTYHQVKDKGRRLLQQQLWKTGRTKVVADGAHKTAKTIALQVLKKYEE